MHHYFDKEFYSIERKYGAKYIHIWGYFYNSFEPEDRHYRLVEYIGFEERLEDFLRWKDDKDTYDKKQSACKQSIEDFACQEALNAMRTFYNGKPPARMSWDRLSMETPEGNYVNY